MNDDRAGASAGNGIERMKEREEREKSKSVGFSLDLVAAVTCEILYIGPHLCVDVSPRPRAPRRLRSR